MSVVCIDNKSRHTTRRVSQTPSLCERGWSSSARPRFDSSIRGSIEEVRDVAAGPGVQARRASCRKDSRRSRCPTECAHAPSSVAVAGGAPGRTPPAIGTTLTGSGRRRSRPRCPSYRTQGPASACRRCSVPEPSAEWPGPRACPFLPLAALPRGLRRPARLRCW
jgi:hypothetical protein